jgi:RHS repeat-associated protein
LNTGTGGTVDNIFDLSARPTIANPGADKERTYTYDNNGNLTSVSAPNTPWYNRTYTYDALNRLNHAEGPYGMIDYTYDDIGNRLTKTESGVTDTYAYVTDTNILDTVTGTDTIIYTHDANGNITGIGNKIVFHYDFNGNIIAESDLDANFTAEYLYRGKGRVAKVDVRSGEIYYFGNDRLGTPQILTDSTNTVVWEGIYKPFGEADVNPNSSVVNNFRFPGQCYDQETGLHYNYHRYYDPRMGRYLRADPIGLAGGINLYVYAENNPINYTDPSGQYVDKLIIGAVVLGIAGYYVYQYYVSVREASKTGDVIQRLSTELDIAYRNKDFESAAMLDSAIRDLRGKKVFLKSWM